MEYRVKTIGSKDEIYQCERFEINHYQWRCLVKPVAYGYMGYVKGEGMYILMCCEETDPLRRCKNHRDMVCKDSAMEAFLAFTDPGETVTNDAMYLNFEVNANGAMYAKHGYKAEGRVFLTDEMYAATGVRAEMLEDRWQASLLIPEGFLRDVCGWDPDGSGKDMYCNFYKIAEDKEIEHYVSFAPIGSETPNFHLPEFFAKVRM